MCESSETNRVYEIAFLPLVRGGCKYFNFSVEIKLNTYRKQHKLGAKYQVNFINLIFQHTGI